MIPVIIRSSLIVVVISTRRSAVSVVTPACIRLLLYLSFLWLLSVECRVLIPAVLLGRWAAVDLRRWTAASNRHSLALKRQRSVLSGDAHASFRVRVHHGLRVSNASTALVSGNGWPAAVNVALDSAEVSPPDRVRPA